MAISIYNIENTHSTHNTSYSYLISLYSAFCLHYITETEFIEITNIIVGW